MRCERKRAKKPKIGNFPTDLDHNPPREETSELIGKGKGGRKRKYPRLVGIQFSNDPAFQLSPTRWISRDFGKNSPVSAIHFSHMHAALGKLENNERSVIIISGNLALH